MNPSQNPSALRSKKAITETLLRLMSQYPYAEITVKHILLEAEVSRKTFYRNFSSKDDVLNACIDAILHSYIEAITAQEPFSFLKILDTIFYFCEKNKELLFLLRDNELLYLLLMKLNTLMQMEHRKISRHKPDSQPYPEEQPLSDYIIAFNIGGIWNIIVRWVENDMADSVNDIKNSIIYYLSDIKNIDLRDV